MNIKIASHRAALMALPVVCFLSASQANASIINVNLNFDGTVLGVPDRGVPIAPYDLNVDKTVAINEIQSVLGSSPLDASEINSVFNMAWGTASIGSTQSSLSVITHQFDFTDPADGDWTAFNNSFASNDQTINPYGGYLTAEEWANVTSFTNALTGESMALYQMASFNGTTFDTGSFIPIARLVFTNGVTVGNEVSEFDVSFDLVDADLVSNELITNIQFQNTPNVCTSADEIVAGIPCDYDGLKAVFGADPNSRIVTGDPDTGTGDPTVIADTNPLDEVVASSFWVSEGSAGSSILWATKGSLHGFGFLNASQFAITSITTTTGTTSVYYPDGSVVTVPAPAPLALISAGLLYMLGTSRKKKMSM
ncbi:MAG: hypothetical protein OEZ43_05655 [Gammaproteobacteria bacterium]|nr:hypothetical protein [Gammaproteobacteria bacterium]